MLTACNDALYKKGKRRVLGEFYGKTNFYPHFLFADVLRFSDRAL